LMNGISLDTSRIEPPSPTPRPSFLSRTPLTLLDRADALRLRSWKCPACHQDLHKMTCPRHPTAAYQARHPSLCMPVTVGKRRSDPLAHDPLSPPRPSG
jgi:hypothetical protein